MAHSSDLVCRERSYFGCHCMSVPCLTPIVSSTQETPLSSGVRTQLAESAAHIQFYLSNIFSNRSPSKLLVSSIVLPLISLMLSIVASCSLSGGEDRGSLFLIQRISLTIQRVYATPLHNCFVRDITESSNSR